MKKSTGLKQRLGVERKKDKMTLKVTNRIATQSKEKIQDSEANCLGLNSASHTY